MTPTPLDAMAKAALAALIAGLVLLAGCTDPPPHERPRQQWSEEESGAYGDSQRSLQSLTDCVLNYSRNARDRGLPMDGIIDAGFLACDRIAAEYKEYALSWATFHVTDSMAHPHRHKAELEAKVTALNHDTVESAFAAIRAQARLIVPGAH